jgi:predicted nucleic acid-binding protein
MRTVLVDAGPLYALSDPSDQYHRRAREQMKRLVAQGYFVAVSYPTLVEVHTLVLRRLGPAYAHGWLKDLFDRVIPINPEPGEYQKAVLRVLKYPDQTITLCDAVVAVLAEELNQPVWTYDHHFDIMRAVRWN